MELHALSTNVVYTPLYLVIWFTNALDWDDHYNHTGIAYKQLCKRMNVDLCTCVHVVIFLTVTSKMTVVLCPATASALKKNTSLTKLSLVECHIDAEGASHLEQALRVNTTLRVLNLSHNIAIGSQGAEHLGKLSSGVWGYGLTCNTRQCQCATSNREMSVVKNVSIKMSIFDGAMLLF